MAAAAQRCVPHPGVLRACGAGNIPPPSTAHATAHLQQGNGMTRGTFGNGRALGCGGKPRSAGCRHSQVSLRAQASSASSAHTATTKEDSRRRPAAWRGGGTARGRFGVAATRAGLRRSGGHSSGPHPGPSSPLPLPLLSSPAPRSPRGQSLANKKQLVTNAAKVQTLWSSDAFCMLLALQVDNKQAITSKAENKQVVTSKQDDAVKQASKQDDAGGGHVGGGRRRRRSTHALKSSVSAQRTRIMALLLHRSRALMAMGEGKSGQRKGRLAGRHAGRGRAARRRRYTQA